MKLEPGFRNYAQYLNGAQLAHQLVQCALETQRPLLFLAENVGDLNELEDNLSFFLPEQANLLRFSDWETLPYDSFSPHQDIISDRLQTLARIKDISIGLQRPTIIIATVGSALTRLCPASHIDAQRFQIQTGQKVSQGVLCSQLTNGGYLHVDTVREHGEFATRGGLLDVFPMGSKTPIRLDWFDDEIDSIRWFDPETQRTVEKVDAISILPARELPTTEQGVSRFRQRFRERFERTPLTNPIYQDVSEGSMPAGIEYYLPLFFERTESLLEYLPDNAIIARQAHLKEQYGAIKADFEQRYESLAYDVQKPLLKPEEICLREDELFRHLNRYPSLVFATDPDANSSYRLVADVSADAKSQDPLTKLRTFISNIRYPVLLVAESAGRREALLELLRSADIRPHYTPDWQTFVATHQPLSPLPKVRLPKAFSIVATGYLLPKHKYWALAFRNKDVARILTYRKSQSSAT